MLGLNSWHRGKMQKPGIILSLLILRLQQNVVGGSCCHPSLYGGSYRAAKSRTGGDLEAPCSAQPVPACQTPEGKYCGSLGTWVHDAASSLGLGIPGPIHQCFHVLGFALSLNSCCKMQSHTLLPCWGSCLLQS